MSDHQRSAQRIAGLGGIKPSKMPGATAPGIPVIEAERRLGIAPEPFEAEKESIADDLNSSSGYSPGERTPESNTEGLHSGLPESLQQRKPRQITVSRTFRLPLELVNELEQIASLHDIPMVTIVAEALKLHLKRFPKEKTI